MFGSELGEEGFSDNPTDQSYGGRPLQRLFGGKCSTFETLSLGLKRHDHRTILLFHISRLEVNFDVLSRRQASLKWT